MTEARVLGYHPTAESTLIVDQQLPLDSTYEVLKPSGTGLIHAGWAICKSSAPGISFCEAVLEEQALPGWLLRQVDHIPVPTNDPIQLERRAIAKRLERLLDRDRSRLAFEIRMLANELKQ